MMHPRLGSVELQIDGVSRELVKSGVNGVVVYTRRTRGFHSREIRDGVEYRRFGILHGHRLITPFQGMLFPKASKPVFSSRFYYATFFAQVAADLRKQTPDVIHIHNFSQFLPLARWASPRSKIVIHMHNEWLTQFEPKLIRARLQHADAIVGCSRFVVDRVRNRLPEFSDRCFAVYNAVDTCKFQPASPPARNKRILYVGRISPEKGIHVLIDAVGEVLKRVPDATLDLWGSDLFQGRRMMIDLSDDSLTLDLAHYCNSNYQKQLERRLSPELARRVRFCGFVPNSQLAEIYRTAEVLVLPSVGHESFGIPAAEAAASGLPAIVTRSGGLPELVVDGVTGYVVNRANSGQLADAIVRMLSDDSAKTRMGREARNRAVQLFSWETSGKETLALYRRLLASRSVPNPDRQSQAILQSVS